MSNITTQSVLEGIHNEDELNGIFRKDHAFVIGISDFDNDHVFDYLPNASNDANAVYDLFKKHHKYSSPNDGAYIDLEFEAMKTLLEETMPNEVKEDDRVIFYFAGHGGKTDKPKTVDDEPDVGFLVMKDSDGSSAPTDEADMLEKRMIPYSYLIQKLEALKCRHMLVILDACFSGGIKWASKPKTRSFTFDEDDIQPTIYGRKLWEYARFPAWQIITSAGTSQKAQDASYENGKATKNSPFAETLINSLGGAVGKSASDASGDGLITLTELFGYLQDQVFDMVEGVAQKPQYITLGKHQDGEFFFLDPHGVLNLPRIPTRDPFVGFRPYEPNERKIFFPPTFDLEADSELTVGTRRQTDVVPPQVSSLINDIQQHQLVHLDGVAGTGKTSLIQAGLIPAISDKMDLLFEIKLVEGDEAFDLCVQPFSNFSLSEDTEEDTSSKVSRNPFGSRCGDLIKGILSQHEGSNHLLLIDGYEKFAQAYLQKFGMEQLQSFEADIAGIINYNEGFKLLLGMRTDALILEGEERGIKEIQAKSLKQISDQLFPDITSRALHSIPSLDSSLSADEILKKISHTTMFQESFSFIDGSNLWDKIQKDLGKATQKLPAYSYVMQQLYLAYKNDEYGSENREFGNEHLDSLGEGGGVLGALTKHVMQAYEEMGKKREGKFHIEKVDLSSNGKGKKGQFKEIEIPYGEIYQQTMRKLILRMVRYDGQEAKMGRVRADHLIFDPENKKGYDEQEILWEIIQELLDKRVITSHVNRYNEISYALIHPGLLESWERLKVWVNSSNYHLKLKDGLRRYLDEEGGASSSDVRTEEDDTVEEMEEDLVTTPGDTHAYNMASPFYKEIIEPYIKRPPVQNDLFKVWGSRFSDFAKLWADDGRKESLDALYRYKDEPGNLLNLVEGNFIHASKNYMQNKIQAWKIWRRIALVSIAIAFVAVLLSLREANIQKDNAERQFLLATIEKHTANSQRDEVKYQNFKQIIDVARSEFGAQAWHSYDSARMYWDTAIINEAIYMLPKNYVHIGTDTNLIYSDTIYKKDEIETLKKLCEDHTRFPCNF